MSDLDHQSAAEPLHDITCLREDLLAATMASLRASARPIFDPRQEAAAINAFVAHLAQQLAPRIGGRYIPKSGQRALRDAAVRAMFNGRNLADVMRHFGLSKRHVYRILGER